MRLNFDPILVLSLAGLSGFSLAVIASTNPKLFPSQLIFFLLSAGLYIIFARLDYRVYKPLLGFLYLVSVISLIIPFIGPEIRGAQRWIDILGFRLQTSEVVKPAIFVILAQILSQTKFLHLPSKLAAGLAISLPILIIFKQPDLGNVIVYLGVFVLLLIARGIKIRNILSLAIVSVLFFPLIWNNLAEYQKLRIITFLDPGADPAGAGYNALQSTIAIGSGGIFGLGLGRGTQSHLRFLPEFHTDFAFASQIEEFGFISGIFILACYFILLFRLLLIARQTADSFGRLIVIALFSQIIIQLFINIGMNIGILPVTGITLPFLSYGGSSIIGLSIALGLVYSVDSQNVGKPLVVA
ncbi:rod shape-determining protein RodA [Candidatus Gottesmanbacteria bacterium]|nr:rod shape-determining protein RodA [Candidatus Gottesmanbacteria bacterium]